MIDVDGAENMGIGCCQTTDAAETLRINADGSPEFALYLNEAHHGPKVWITCVACPACGEPTSAAKRPEPPLPRARPEPLEAPKELAAARATLEERTAELVALLAAAQAVVDAADVECRCWGRSGSDAVDVLRALLAKMETR